MSLRDRLNKLERGTEAPQSARLIVYDPATGLPLPVRWRHVEAGADPLEDEPTVIWIPDNGRDPPAPG